MALNDPSVDPNFKYSTHTFPGNGSQITWEINFSGGFIDKTHVKAFATPSVGAAYSVTLTWTGSATVQTAVAIPTGSTLTIYRDTPKDEPLVSFTDGAVVAQANLDNNARQAVFVAAEAHDDLTNVENQLLRTIPDIQAIGSATLEAISEAAGAQTLAIAFAGTSQLNYINTAAASVLANSVLPFTSLAAALAGTVPGQRAVVVPQAGGLYQDTYLRKATTLAFQRTDPAGLAGIAIEQHKALEDASVALTPWPVAPIIDINPVDGKAQLGEFIPNRAAPYPDRDLYQFPRQIVPNAPATVTYDFATDPWGGNTAIRVQMPSVTFVQLFGGTTPVNAAGDYRIEFFARSNAGAGVQSFGVGASVGPGSGTIFNTTEGGWTKVSVALPGLAPNAEAYITYSGVTDIFITKPRVTYVQVSLGDAVPVPVTGGVVREKLLYDNFIAFGAGNSFVAPMAGRLTFMPDRVSKRSFAAMTMILSLKATGPGSPFSEMFFSKDPINQLSMGVTNEAGPGNTFRWIMPGLDVRWGDPSTAGWTILALRFDAARSDAHFGSMLVRNLTSPAAGTGTGGTPFQIASAYFGGAGYQDGFAMPGFGGPAAIFDSYLSDAALQQAVARVKAKLTLYGDVFGTRNILITEGDSITYGIGASQLALAWAAKVASNLSIQRVNYAVAGSALPDLQARLPQVLARIAEAKADGVRPSVTVMVGVNSIPAMSDLIAYWEAIRAAGAKLVACTVTSANSQNPANTDSYNAAIRAASSHYDALADVGANAHLGGDGAYADTTYFGDGLHPSDTGHALIETIVRPALNSQLA